MTATGDPRSMRSEQASTGVCIIRVEPRTGGLRFSVLTTAHADAERAQTCLETCDLAEAVDTVEGFLVDFARAHHQPRGGPPTG